VSDHAGFLPDTSAAADFEGSDSQYFEEIIEQKPKAAKQPPSARVVVAELISEIEECLKAKPVVGATFEERIVFSRSDVAFCPMCSFQDFDRFRLQEHLKGHPEIAAFRQDSYRRARKYEGMLERKKQLLGSAERLKVELRNIDKEIAAFDVAGMRERQKQLSVLTRLLYG
jgi:hypothetical protein